MTNYIEERLNESSLVTKVKSELAYADCRPLKESISVILVLMYSDDSEFIKSTISLTSDSDRRSESTLDNRYVRLTEKIRPMITQYDYLDIWKWLARKTFDWKRLEKTNNWQGFLRVKDFLSKYEESRLDEKSKLPSDGVSLNWFSLSVLFSFYLVTDFGWETAFKTISDLPLDQEIEDVRNDVIMSACELDGTLLVLLLETCN